MNNQELEAKLDEIRASGARGVELLYVERSGFQVDMPTQTTPVQRPHSTAELTVRVWLEGGRRAARSGPASKADALVRGALEDAAAAPEDALEGPVERLSSVAGGLSILDRRLDQVEELDRVEVLTTAFRAATVPDPRLVASDFAYRDERQVRRFVNSKGLSLEESSTSYVAHGTVSADTPQGRLSVSDRIASRSFASIASLPLGTSIGRRLTQLLQEGPTLPDGPVRALLPARVTAQLVAALGTRFQDHTLGDPGAFFLTRGERGTLDRRLHLVDDGTLSGGLRTYSMDDRGVSPVPLTLLKEGQVDAGFVGIAEARRHDVRPTGHRFGDELRASNLVLKSGTRSVNACLSELGGPSLMIDDLGDPSGLDLTTGELDTTVNGLVMDANQVVGAMRGVRLRGSLHEALNSVAEVCSDTDRLGHVDAPAMIVHGFTIEG
ncbi:MAG: hypothetical protein KTR31_35730 [Myxococcales bacterium]|nr:hypothetical protein [Myxococcales bacterium]